MASNHDTQFAAAFEYIRDEFGESVTAKATGGSTQTLTVVVNRDTLQPVGPDGALQKTLTIDVAVADWPTVTEGSDIFNVARKVGGTAEAFKVMKVVSEGGGYRRLRLA